MTYALAWPLQEAIYAALNADPGVVAVLGDRIYDAPPPFSGPAEAEAPYVTLGDERAEDWSTATDAGAVHTVTLSVHAPRHGFGVAKQAAGAVSDALLGAALTLSRGRVVNVRFIEALSARAEDGQLRRIDLRFRVVLEDTV